MDGALENYIIWSFCNNNNQLNDVSIESLICLYKYTHTRTQYIHTYLYKVLIALQFVRNHSKLAHEDIYNKEHIFVWWKKRIKVCPQTNILLNGPPFMKIYDISEEAVLVFCPLTPVEAFSQNSSIVGSAHIMIVIGSK